MEKSIEAIWKNGFLNNDALVAPRLNDLYNQKSRHIIDRLKRTFRANLIALVIMSAAIVICYYFINAMWEGIIIAASLMALAWYSKRQVQHTHPVHQHANSYEYLKSFDDWIKDMMNKNILIMRFFYPLTFLAAFSAVWFGGNNNKTLKNKVLSDFPDLMVVGGTPVIVWVGVIATAALIAYLSDKIYYWDVRIVYGRILKKLEDTLADMEELRS